MDKTIKFRRDYEDMFTKNTEHVVKIIDYGIIGGFETNVNYGTMDGGLDWSALCEFSDGRVVPLLIGIEIDIIK